MAGIYLKLGTVRSQKSSILINTAHRYEDKGEYIFCLKSSRDIRDIGVIASRNGLKRECYMLEDNEDLVKIIQEENKKAKFKGKKLQAIFIDEGQLLSKKHIKQIIILSQKYSILIYGLRNDYKAKTWEVISILENFAKSIEEIKNPCQYCNSLAKLNLRVVNGKPIVEGDSIIIDESLTKSDFVPVCSNCYIDKVGITHI